MPTASHRGPSTASPKPCWTPASAYRPDRATTACFTGHRPSKFAFGYDESDPGLIALLSALSEAVGDAMSRGYRTFVTGMAIGVDTWAAEECLSRRDRGEGIEVVAAIPCIGQDRRWPQASRGRYASIVSRCDRAVLVTESEYTGSCMHARDRWMVDSSGLLMAVYDGTPGGTRHTYRYAKRQGLTVARIVPAGDATTYSSPFREPAPEQCGLPLW